MMKPADFRLPRNALPSMTSQRESWQREASMRWHALVFLLLSATWVQAQPDRKLELANRIVDDLFSMWSEADMPAKYSFLVWPAYKELSKESNWPRLEFIRDIWTVGDLFEVWPSRETLVQAVYQNLPPGLLREYVDFTDAQKKAAAGRAVENTQTLLMPGASLAKQSMHINER